MMEQPKEIAMKNAGAAWIVPVAAVALLSAVGVAGYSLLAGDCSGGGCFISSMFCDSKASSTVTPAAAKDEGDCPLCPEQAAGAVVTTVSIDSAEEGGCEGVKACSEGEAACDGAVKECHSPCEGETTEPATLASDPR